MQSQLAEINRDLDQLSAKIEKSSDAVKAEAKPKFEALRKPSGQLKKAHVGREQQRRHH